jgi:hypothetical protein
MHPQAVWLPKLMNIKDADLPSLQELENAVMTAWNTHPDITDHTISRVYDTLHHHYRNRLLGRDPKPPTLNGADREIFDALQKVCEKLLATGAAPMAGLRDGNTNPLTLEQLVGYLRELMRSVERHTLASGRYGYLGFLRQYVSGK